VLVETLNPAQSINQSINQSIIIVISSMRVVWISNEYMMMTLTLRLRQWHVHICTRARDFLQQKVALFVAKRGRDFNLHLETSHPPGDGQYAGVHRTQKSHSVAELGIFHFIPQCTHTDETHVLSSFSCLFYASSVVKFKQYTVHFNCLIPVVCWHAQTYPHARVPPATCTSVYNPLIPTVAILVHLWSTLCHTRLSCHL